MGTPRHEMAPKQRALKLPKVLIDQLGGEEALSGNGRKSRPRAGSRKELRKAARVEKKASRSGPPPAKRAKVYHDESQNHGVNSKALAVSKPLSTKPSRDDSAKEPVPKSILKRPKRAVPEPEALKPQRSVSPPTKISRAVQDKLAEEDEEIAALEKKLGLKGKKGLPQSFKDDGLDELLEGLGGEEEVDEGDQQKRKRKAEGDEWLLKGKRRSLRTKKMIVIWTMRNQKRGTKLMMTMGRQICHWMGRSFLTMSQRMMRMILKKTHWMSVTTSEGSNRTVTPRKKWSSLPRGYARTPMLRRP